MPRLLVIARESQALTGLCDELARNGFDCSTASYNDEVTGLVARQSPDLILVEVNERSPDSETWQLIKGIKRVNPLPVMALVAREMLESIEGHPEADDFIPSPYDVKEVVVRAKRLLDKTRKAHSGELIDCGSLVIDLARCEVTINGNIIELTFKEYEMLKLLAANRGRVYTREDLLNKVWGYDYYGGARTVDTHIRRLRSKTENAQNTFIETVRNIGYRFKKDN
ncbi:MAG: response regulator transcription factor [Dehalococcoidales bacterium]